MSNQRKLLCAGMLLALAFGGCAMAGDHDEHPRGAATKAAEADEHEEKIAVDKLPAAVTDAVKKAMPAGTITDAEKQTDDGKTVYELDVKSGGTTYEVKVTEAGKIISQEVDKEDDHKN